jgi:hypothetical protein
LPTSQALIPVAVTGSGSRQKAQRATDLEGSVRPGLDPVEFEKGIEGAARSLRSAVPVEAMALSKKPANPHG